MHAVNHLHERYRNCLYRYVAKRNFAIIDGDFYKTAKKLFGMSKSNVDKVVNDLVNDGEIIFEGGEYGAIIVRLVKKSEVAE